MPGGFYAFTLSEISHHLVWIGLLLGTSCSKDPQKYIASGKDYLSQGKYSEAIIELPQCGQVARTSRIPLSLSLAYLGIGQFGEAYRRCFRTVQLDPQNLQAQMYLANTLLMDRKFEDARVKAEFVLTRNPDMSLQRK